MPADKKNQGTTSGQSPTGAGAGMQVSGEQIFKEEENKPKVTQESDVFGQQSTSGDAQGGGARQAGQQSGNQPSESAQQIASHVTEALRGNTTGVTETAKEAINQAKDVAGQVATQAFGQVQQKAGSAIDTQKQNLTQGLNAVAQSIRSLGENLRTSDQQSPVATFAARYSDTAAGQVEQLARYFETSDLRDLSRDIQGFARRNPTVFVAGAFVTGLLAARFLKSSPRQELMIRDQNRGADAPSRGRQSNPGSRRGGSGSSTGSAPQSDRNPTAGAGAAPNVGATEATGTAGRTGLGSGTTTTNPSEVG